MRVTCTLASTKSNAYLNQIIDSGFPKIDIEACILSILGVPPTLFGCPRLILANTTLTTSTTQPITTRPYSIRPMFNEDIQKGSGAFLI